MQYVISYNFNLLENFVNIINHKHYLIISAKYHSSNMNDVHTMSLANMSTAPQKVVQPIAFFLNSKHLFVWHLSKI